MYDTSSDNEWQRMTTGDTTRDNEWYNEWPQMVQRVTTNGNNDNGGYNESK